MAISIDNLNSALGSSAIGADVLSGVSSSNRLTKQINEAGTDEEMMSACEDFEAYLLQKMFQSMEETAKVFSDEEENNEYVDMFQDNMYQALAESMMASGSGLGIAQILYDSMARNTGIVAESVEAEQ